MDNTWTSKDGQLTVAAQWENGKKAFAIYNHGCYLATKDTKTKALAIARAYAINKGRKK